MIKNRNLFGTAILFAVLLLVSITEISAQKNAKGGVVCGDASKPECTKNDTVFKPYSLVFKLGPKAIKDPQQYAEKEKSVEFYAVLLKTVNGYKPAGGCREITEAERTAAQEMFPGNKVYSYNFYCLPNATGDLFLVYKFAGATDSTHLLAVYGGQTQADAAKILTQAKKKYPKARIVKMRAEVVMQYDV